jgi:polyhydroxyalkanoate synthesis repressor PhaR
MRLIKRYRNRRLYDTQTSRTITQNDLVRLIGDGVSLKVVDSDTGEDVTMSVLGRLIARQAETLANDDESQRLFRRIIQIGGMKSMSILKNTVLASIGAFQVTKEKAEKVIDELIKRGEVSESERKSAVMELLERAEKSTAGWREKVSKEVKKAVDEVNKLGKEVKDYKLVKQSDLTGLEEKINNLNASLQAIEKRLEEM